MTLNDYMKSLPKERVQAAATDLAEAARIEQEHAALPGAIFDTQEAAERQANGGTGSSESVAPANSFNLSDDADAGKFIKGMELSHPELVNRLRRDERVWDEMVDLDRIHTERLNRDGGLKFTGDEASDYDFFRWAYGRGILEGDTSIGGLASAFGRGLWQMVKGAGKLARTTATSALNPGAAIELAATTVDAAQSAVAEYQQLGAGLAALTAGDNPQVKMAAMYEVAKFADEEQRNHNAWRKAIDESFAEVPVDEDSVEFLSEAFDISNLIGAGAGKMVTRGLKRVGASGAADLLGASRQVWGSELAAKAISKVPIVGVPYRRAILTGQADVLSVEATAAYADVAQAQADLAAKRATLAASPASSPRDALLKQIAEGEADLAKKQAAYDATKAQLDAMRQGVSETLDLEGRGLLNRTAAGTLETAGKAVRGTGRLMTRTYRGASELLTGEADNAAFDLAAGQIAGNVVNRGNIITRAGQDLIAAGRTMAENGASIPYFRRLRQAEDASKLTRGAAAFIDWSHLGWAADKAGELGTAAAAGAPISGAFGYVASGGDLAAAAESAGAGAAYGIGGGAYGQWQAYKDPAYRWEELLANRRQFRDALSRREVGGESQLRIFDRMGAGDQIAISTYAQGSPDVAFRFINDPKQASGYYDRENNVVVVNRASKTPLTDIFRHEVAHFVERHGLQAQVREMYLGDAEKGVVGQYTAMDPLGNPVFVESTGPDGERTYRYKLNEAGRKLKAEYEAKIRAVDPTFSMSDEYLASELFAEQYAERLLGGGFRRDLGRNAVDSIVDALASKPFLKGFLGNIGLLFDQSDKIVGTGVFTDLKRNPSVDALISRWNSEVAKGRGQGIGDEADQHVFTETELRDPEVATKWLQGGGAMRFGADGKPVYDSKGVPQFLTEKEADALQRDLANELITQIEKHVAENPADADLLQRREIVDLNGVKRTVFTGRLIPEAVIDALEAQNRFNPHQLAHLRAASASVDKNGVGAMIAHFYQAASRKLGGKAYKSVGGRWRRDGVVGFQVTKDGNVVLNTVSWEQLSENARQAAKTKLAREIYATAGVPVDSAITADVKTYLGNLIDGKPGATDLGETRRDFINNLLGIRMASNAEANPLFEVTTAPKTVLTNLRLDRMNRMAPLDYVEYAWGPKQYRQAKANMRPDTASVLTVDLQDSLWANALKTYGNKAAGFSEGIGRTENFSKALREAEGLKLWENMTFAEQGAEFRAAAIRDLRVAAKEAINPTDYLLDRALDPLDPMNGVYKALLQNAGAEIDGDRIRVPAVVRKALDGDSALPQLQFRPDAVNYSVGSEDHFRAIDSLGKKDAPQTKESVRKLKYPVNPHPESVTLPPRWGLVNRNIVGMPRSYSEITAIVDRVEKRLRAVMVDRPEFAKESARFYRDMAESSLMMVDAIFPEEEGLGVYEHADLMLRFLALGSPRTDVAGNATKSSGSAAAAGAGFVPGYKLGFTQQQRGAQETYNAWRQKGHFDLENTSGVDDKVRSFYLNGIAELIEMAAEKGDTAAVELLTLRSGRSLDLVGADVTKLTPELKAEIDRHLDGKATVDMWDMAGKGFAWPGFILRKSERNWAAQPFQWSQDKFSKTSTLADNAWKTVVKDLEVAGPEALRYQQARALRIDGNLDWTEKTWAERIKSPFTPETEFTYFTQGTEAGLSPGGGGPLYDAQQAIDGLVSDRLNADGLAEAFGKTKLKARNAQEILWALEKLDNPIESNNDLSLFGNSFKSLTAEVQNLRLGKAVTKKSRAEAILAAMDRAYTAMAMQQLPFEVVTSGQSPAADLIRGKVAQLGAAGIGDPAAVLTDNVANGLGDRINDLASDHDLNITVDQVIRGQGGYTENDSVSTSPNAVLIVRGSIADIRNLNEVIARALDQDGANVIRRPTVRELNDANVKKNTVVTFDTRGLTSAQRDAFFLDLSNLRDDAGQRFLTGFTETVDGIAIGDQFYDGNMAAEIAKKTDAIRGILDAHNVPRFRSDRMIIDTYKRGTPGSALSATPFANALTQDLQDRVRNAGRSGAQFPQNTDAAALLRRRVEAGTVADPEQSKTERKENLTKLASSVDAAVLRGELKEAAASIIKKLLPKE